MNNFNLERQKSADIPEETESVSQQNEKEKISSNTKRELENLKNDFQQVLELERNINDKKVEIKEQFDKLSFTDKINLQNKI
jgi:hypothetical protein